MSGPPSSAHYAIITLHLSSVKELASAQQKMYEIVVCRVCMTRAPDNVEWIDGPCFKQDSSKVGGGREIGSGVLLFPVSIDYLQSGTANCNVKSENDAKIEPPNELQDILQALKESNNKLIIRQWKRGACWWNLNTNDGGDRLLLPSNVKRGYHMHSRMERHAHSETYDTEQLQEEAARNLTTVQMAHAEITGYNLSRRALQSRRDAPYISRVLYFSYDWHPDYSPVALQLGECTNIQYSRSNKSCDSQGFVEPWALLSYFEHRQCAKWCNGDLNISVNSQFNVDFILEYTDLHNLDSTKQNCVHLANCNHYPTTMIKTRHEFGFDEPHPRHGRVPADECLEYTLMVLRDAVLPVQRFFFLGVCSDGDVSFGNDVLKREVRPIAWASHSKFELRHTTRPFQYTDMVLIYKHALDGLLKSNAYNTSDSKTITMIEILQKCISTLVEDWTECNSSCLPPVLCHMDLQPQNLAFWHESDKLKGNLGHRCDGCHVAAVMDWEEACYADPRFELMMLCRKVLANRDQAEMVWQTFSEHVQAWKQEASSQRGNHEEWEVGPIEPWLKLECVHSLCTLIIQLLDKDGGGRSPWETKPDLLAKFDRERQRLVMMGWLFCDLGVA
jgi:hypothetical protein